MTLSELEVDLRSHVSVLDSNACCWLLVLSADCVRWASVDSQNVRWPPVCGAPDVGLLDELWLFGDTGELHIWRTAGGLRGRQRLDHEGAMTDIVEEYQVMWGTDVDTGGPAAGWSTLREARGVKMVFPALLRVDDLPVRLRIRSYVSYSGEGLAYVMDSRLVAVCTEKLGTIACGPQGKRNE